MARLFLASRFPHTQSPQSSLTPVPRVDLVLMILTMDLQDIKSQQWLAAVHSCFLPKADRFMLEAFTSLVRESRLPVIRVLGNRSIDPTCSEDLIIKYCAF